MGDIRLFSYRCGQRYFIFEPQGALHGELNQPSPLFQADRPESVTVYGRIEGHYNLMLSLLMLKHWSLVTVIKPSLRD